MNIQTVSPYIYPWNLILLILNNVSTWKLGKPFSKYMEQCDICVYKCATATAIAPLEGIFIQATWIKQPLLFGAFGNHSGCITVQQQLLKYMVLVKYWTDFIWWRFSFLSNTELHEVCILIQTYLNKEDSCCKCCSWLSLFFISSYSASERPNRAILHEKVFSFGWVSRKLTNST